MTTPTGRNKSPGPNIQGINPKTPEVKAIRDTIIDNIGKKYPSRCHKAPEGACAYCDEERKKGNDFHPSHDASHNCASGRHNHCSCDTCF